MGRSKEVDMKSSMRNALTGLILTGGLVLTPLVAQAATPAARAQATAKGTKDATKTGTKSAKASQSEHVTTGTVKSVDNNTLVITRSGKKHSEMAFDLNSTVHREGTVAAGSHVSIRYREDGSRHVATAITVRRPA